MSNNGKSFWEMLGIDRDDNNAILNCAATLDDATVTKVITSTFPHDIMARLRSWLGDALKVKQVER